MGTAYQHVVVSYGECVIICVNGTVRGGPFNVHVGGIGLLGRGPELGWANLPVDERHDN